MIKRFFILGLIIYGMAIIAGRPNSYSLASRYTTLRAMGQSPNDLEVFDDLLREIKDISTQLHQSMVSFSGSEDQRQNLESQCAILDSYYNDIDYLRWTLCWRNGIDSAFLTQLSASSENYDNASVIVHTDSAEQE